jgi:hypothetical protein
MVDCLAAYATGVFPSGDPLPVSPFDEDPVVTMDLQDTTHGPFPGHGESPYVVSKGLIRVFAVATGQSLWQGFVEVRVPDNTRTSSRTALVVDAIWKELIKAGVLSPS